MRLASIPLSISRLSVPQRRTWQYLGLAVLLVVLFSTISPNRREQITGMIPPKLRPQPTRPLRPGAYVDATRRRNVPDVLEDPPLVEADGGGTLHDQRDGKFYQGGTQSLTSDEVPPNRSPMTRILITTVKNGGGAGKGLSSLVRGREEPS